MGPQRSDLKKMLSLKLFPSPCVVKMEKVQLEVAVVAARAEEFESVAVEALASDKDSHV